MARALGRYLPPECFKANAVITSKVRTARIRACRLRRPRAQVDVWSMGIILYQALIGRRPFGHGMTQVLNARSVSPQYVDAVWFWGQEAMLSENTIGQAGEVVFPKKPLLPESTKV